MKNDGHVVSALRKIRAQKLSAVWKVSMEFAKN